MQFIKNIFAQRRIPCKMPFSRNEHNLFLYDEKAEATADCIRPICSFVGLIFITSLSSPSSSCARRKKRNPTAHLKMMALFFSFFVASSSSLKKQSRHHLFWSVRPFVPCSFFSKKVKIPSILKIMQEAIKGYGIKRWSNLKPLIVRCNNDWAVERWRWHFLLRACAILDRVRDSICLRSIFFPFENEEMGEQHFFASWL